MKRHALTLILVAQMGSAFAAESTGSSHEEFEAASPPSIDDIVSDEDRESRFPSVWNSVQENPKPTVRTSPVWAQDGYLFKYSF